MNFPNKKIITKVMSVKKSRILKSVKRVAETNLETFFSFLDLVSESLCFRNFSHDGGLHENIN